MTVDDAERNKLEQEHVVPVMYLHIEEARRYAPDDISVADLQNLVGPIADRVQDGLTWEKAIEEAVHEYLADEVPKVKEEDLPKDPFPGNPNGKEEDGSHGAT